MSSTEFLAANMRRLRRTKGLTQQHLADVMGIHRTFVGAIEAQRNITLSTLDKVAAALDVSSAELLGVPKPPEADPPADH